MKPILTVAAAKRPAPGGVSLIDVRDADGELTRKVTLEQAESILRQNLGVGRYGGRNGDLKYISLHFVLDVRSARLHSGSASTRPVRGDQTCRSFANGQLMGDPRLLREFSRWREK